MRSFISFSIKFYIDVESNVSMEIYMWYRYLYIKEIIKELISGLQAFELA